MWALIDGGTISGVSFWGSSRPVLACCTRYIAKANCSAFNFPVVKISHKFLKKTFKIYMIKYLWNYIWRISEFWRKKILTKYEPAVLERVHFVWMYLLSHFRWQSHPCLCLLLCASLHIVPSQQEWRPK